jgi:hypothetical protein
MEFAGSFDVINISAKSKASRLIQVARSSVGSWELQYTMVTLRACGRCRIPKTTSDGLLLSKDQVKLYTDGTRSSQVLDQRGSRLYVRVRLSSVSEDSHWRRGYGYHKNRYVALWIGIPRTSALERPLVSWPNGRLCV